VTRNYIRKLDIVSAAIIIRFFSMANYSFIITRKKGGIVYNNIEGIVKVVY
jgi:hypothetical protein